MIKTLKVCQRPQGAKYVPGINLQGLYLNDYNFNIGDVVRVEFLRDEIRIKKLTPDTILKAMAEQNPSLVKLVAEFDCVACD